MPHHLRCAARRISGEADAIAAQQLILSGRFNGACGHNLKIPFYNPMQIEIYKRPLPRRYLWVQLNVLRAYS